MAEDIGEAALVAVVVVGQFFVIEAEQANQMQKENLLAVSNGQTE